jgi:4a-hydroxytetrahydrobiopterin dehydratase
MDILEPEAVAGALTDLDGWSGDVTAIRRTIEMPSFPLAIAAVVRIAEAAEAADHHPDFDIRWRTVTFTLCTHSAGGRVTGKDLAMARTINDIVAA